MNIFLNVFDFSNDHITHNIRDNRTHKSSLNAILGLSMVLSIIFIFYVIIMQFLNGKDFTLIYSIDKTAISYNNFTDMPILFNLLNVRGQPIDPDGIFSLNVNYRHVFFNSTKGKLQANMYPIPYSKCHALTFPQKYISQYEKRILPKFNCLDTSIDKTLINIFGDMKFGHSFFNIDIQKCTNTTYTLCKSSEEIDKILTSTYLGLRIPSHQIDNYKSDKPYSLDITSLSLPITSKMIKSYHLKFDHVSYETDNGLLFSHMKKYDFYTFERYNLDIDLGMEDDRRGGGVIGSIYFENTKGINRYNKIYMKIQRLFSEFGGITNSLVFIYKIFVFIFSRKRKSLMLVNSLIDFESENKNDGKININSETNVQKSSECNINR